MKKVWYGLAAIALMTCVTIPVYAKLTCDQVTCDQARNYSYMDADKDGFYCEKQCGNYTPSPKTTPKKVVPKVVSPAPKAKAKSKYILWPKWGCYYINSKWNKTYVARSFCK